MPSASDYDQLGGIGFTVQSVGWGAEVLIARYGGGYRDQALVGPSRGTHKWKYKHELLPMDTSQISNSGQAWFDYAYEFYKTHTVTSPVFKISWHSKLWTVSYTNPSLDFDRFKSDIYTTGIDIEQVTVRGFTTYASDGSIAP